MTLGKFSKLVGAGIGMHQTATSLRAKWNPIWNAKLHRSTKIQMLPDQIQMRGCVWNTKLQKYKNIIDLIGLEGGLPKPRRGEPEAGPIEASRSVLNVESCDCEKFWMWKGLSCELSVASSDHEKGWLHHLKDVKLVVGVAGQLDGKIIQTMMVSSVWTRMPGNIS